MSRSPMVSHQSSPVTRRCHIIDNRHSMQVSKHSLQKHSPQKHSPQKHRRRFPSPSSSDPMRKSPLADLSPQDSSEIFTPERRRDRSQQAGEPDELCLYSIHPARLG